jgi:NagD protein
MSAPTPERLRRPTSLYDGYIFDLDGTVYLGEALLPGAHTALTTLRRLGRRVVFLSNNPTHSRQDYAAKLTRLGLPTSVDDIVNSSTVMVAFLQKRMPGARLFVVGEEPLCRELAAAGFRLTQQPGEIDAVIASFDRTFAYWKLQTAFDAIRLGAAFFATNGDRYCPVPVTPATPTGGQPDAAAIIAAIEACTNVRVEAIVGKPSSYMAAAILDILKLPPQRCLLTGDRLETDVAMGIAAGMDTALTLTGATSLAALATADKQPTYVVRDLAELIPPHLMAAS